MVAVVRYLCRKDTLAGCASGIIIMYCILIQRLGKARQQTQLSCAEHRSNVSVVRCLAIVKGSP
ncbi:hypothetical protein E2C01_088626 [Portunus trituberculatus]|uniref:Uncharacterized protein n=1 Tax=Portunus trituberculatus TaxID=210409 RepID=A0A5B7JH22_PORTR|nr:hypothetical protein [Portunus trituberculatus]